MQSAINGQAFWQSEAARGSSGQHGMSSGIPTMSGISDIGAAAIAPTADVVNGAKRSPTIARTGSSRLSHCQTVMA